MTARFNPPPGWPPAPAGWTPPPGWSPDPSWPAPPAGWQLWVEDAPGAPQGDDVSRFSKPDPSSAPTTAMPTYQAPGAPGAPGAPNHGAVPPSGPVPTGPGAAWSGSPETPSWQQQGQPGLQGHGGPAGPGGPDGFGGPGGPGGQQPGGAAGRQWLIPVIIALVAIGAIIAVLFATGVLGGSDEPDASPTSSAPTSASPEPSEDATDEPTDDPTTDDATDEPTDTPSDDASDEPTDEATGSVSGDGGSRTSPLAPGETAPLGDWTVSFAATNSDAWAEISESSSSVSSFYEPADGDSYLMSPLTITYLGEGSEPLYMLDYVFVSSDGVTYKDKCGYVPLPNQLETGQELYTDATVTGNICVTVPTDKIDGGVWRISGWDRVNKDTEAFFALS